jgi:hypothetical protein
MRVPRTVLATVLALGLSSSFAASGHAELAAWDPAKVTTLAKQLVEAAGALYDAVYKQPPPQTGSMQSRDYYRLKQQVRHIRSEARELAASLEKGAGHDETLPVYESLMEVVREARETAARVFTVADVQQRATAARQLLNQIAPYYDPDAVELGPVTR